MVRVVEGYVLTYLFEDPPEIGNSSSLGNAWSLYPFNAWRYASRTCFCLSAQIDKSGAIFIGGGLGRGEEGDGGWLGGGWSGGL
jgi:hypothetical protein